MRRKSIPMMLLIAATFVLLLSACGSPTPTSTPTARPTNTEAPTVEPTKAPPTVEPTKEPTKVPPTVEPTKEPTKVPPTVEPTKEPTKVPPTVEPTKEPTKVPPTVEPTKEPTKVPPTVEPTKEPTKTPTAEPTKELGGGAATTAEPTKVPPTVEPTKEPTKVPPTVEPTKEPTKVPPTVEPTKEPTKVPPTVEPTKEPTKVPPTVEPTKEPTAEPTAAVTAPPTVAVVRTPGACKISGELTVGSDAAYPPFENVNTTTNKIEGFDIDLLNAVAAKAGFTPVYENAPFATIFTNLAAGQFEIVVSAASIKPERALTVTFSNPYFAAGQVIIVRKGDETTIKLPADLVGKKIGVQSGTTGADAAKEIKDAQISEYETAPEAFQALANKQVDAVVNDDFVSKAIVQSRAELNLVVVGDPFTTEYYGIVNRKECPELTAKINEGLAAVIADGTYAEIYAKWMGVEPTKEFQKGGKGIQLTVQPTAEPTTEPTAKPTESK